MEKFKKAIALGADLNYLDKVETLIKSISAHNHQVRFYVFNDDLPSEWFLIMKKHLKAIGSEIINVKLSSHSLRNYHLPNEFLSYATYFRYFIGDYAVEDTVLYLDSDMIVTAPLNELFELDLSEYYLAAVQDYGFDGQLPNFNAGMMVINTKRWREEELSIRLLDLTAKHHEEVYGDQGVLNICFENQWLHLDKTYNFMVGLDSIMHLRGNFDWYQSEYQGDYLPKIIHYTAEFKPWTHITLTRFRKVWWFYYGLSWQEILLSSDILNRSFIELVAGPKYHTCIFTNSAGLEQIEFLLEELPEVHVSVLAHTDFAPNVIELQRNSNVSIYPNFNPFNAEEVLEKMDFYLDINHGDEIYDILNKVKQKGKPIFGFDNVTHDHTGESFLFQADQPEQMVVAIKEYLKIKG